MRLLGWVRCGLTLDTSLKPCRLHAPDGLLDSNTREEGIGRKAYRVVSSGLRVSD